MPAPTIGTPVADGTATNGTSLSVPFTSTGKPLIVATFSGDSNPNTTRQSLTCAFGAQSLTLIGNTDDGNFVSVSLWKLDNPTPGTADIVIQPSLGGTIQLGLAAAEWTGLVSIGAPVTASSTSANSVATSALNPGALEVIVAAYGSDDGGSANTVDNGGVKRGAVEDGAHLGGGDCAFAQFTYASTGSPITPSVSSLGGVGGAVIAVILTGAAGAPTINTQPQSQQVNAGGRPATFSVAATTSGGALSYQWKRNGSSVTGETAATMSRPADPADSGASYTCDVTDSNGTTTTAAAILEIAYPTYDGIAPQLRT